LQGKDVLASAQTGTGKTGAYGIPIAADCMTDGKKNTLILLPTRELAVQVIKDVTRFIGEKQNIASALLIGGDDMKKQLRMLKKKPALIVGTPGRINDHIKRGTLRLNTFNFLVLDEVDRMLDMGFVVQLEEIIKHLSHDRQTLMFSATVSKQIQKISKKYLKDPIRVDTGKQSQPLKNLKQTSINVSNKEKFQKLLEALSKRQDSTLVFVNTKRSADMLAKKLIEKNMRATALHGDLRHSKRSRVITDFRNQKFRVLVATDIAARGLDIPHIGLVINYDVCVRAEDHIHRVGRTARAGSNGEALNFISPTDKVKWKGIQKFITSL